MAPSDPAPAAPESATPVAPEPAGAQPQVSQVVQPARRASSARLLNVLLGGALVLAVAGIGFAAGRITATPAGFVGSAVPDGRGSGPVFNMNPGDGNGGVQGGPIGIGSTAGPTIEGTVESITDTTLTLKTADGQTIQIALDDGTTYHAQTDASSSDVATGGKVLVRLDFGSRDGGNVNEPSASDVTVVP
jgi:hypothetical protein